MTNMASTAVGPESVQGVHNRKLREVAATYRRRGYNVLLEPDPTDLPPFLSEFRPDMLATGLGESVVVEVKLAKKTDPTRWRALAEQISLNPGWRFDIVIPEEDDLDDLPSLTTAEIEERLRQAHKMAESGSMDVALMAAWSATEAVLRIMKEKQEVDTPDSQPGTLIARLYSDGDLDRKDYDRLTGILQLRNAATHGYRRKIAAKDITYLAGFAEGALRLHH